ncbi:FAD-binding oxidoreductase [Salicibibacter cibarius]|uniref:FAD-binding oxidoreductase n=1 Tax=Salicibibacter cibarius TaxID=2743000 RepID=A0A7T7CBZ6_9BACI|nr:FAD-binding oxidoreductase [Salicibibacter cibarius]QQK76469.1 FAD-binding oxidoreductase [Salicibibacter cibarius]
MKQQTLGNEGRQRVSPSTPEEVAAILKRANDRYETVIPVGGGTKQGFGGEGGTADVLLSMENLNQVIEYSPGDMTMTVQAGTTMETINETARAEQQMVPLDPSYPTLATIGGVVAANDSGPKRMAYGSARDHVIGLRVADPNGEILRSGGKVVKNVAGYDMNKLLVGSMGTLGVITEVTLKLRPYSPHSSVCVLTFPDEDATRVVKPFVSELLDTHLEPITLEYMDPNLTERMFQTNGYSLVITFEDVKKAIDVQEKWIQANMPDRAELTVFRDNDAEEFWRTFAQLTFTDAVHVKVGSKNMQVLDHIHHCKRLQEGRDVHVYAHGGAGHGISRVYASGDAVQSFVEDLRAYSEQSKGYAILTHAPLDMRTTVGVWGATPGYFSILTGIKEQLDPNGVLNPKRFVGGI